MVKGILDDVYGTVAEGVAQIGDDAKLFGAHLGADIDDLTQLLGVDYFAKLSKEQDRLDKLALKEFANNFYWANTLTQAQAKQNLEEGIVEIVGEGGGHSSNGLLVTRNGYIVTSHHCIDSLDKERLFVRTPTGNYRRITNVVFANEASDIAIVKASIIGSAEALKYRFAAKYDIASTFAVMHLSRWDLNLEKVFGMIRQPRLESVKITGRKHPYHNQVGIHMKTIKGDSGGIVATDKFEVYGVMSSGNTKGVDSSFCTFWFEAVNIINALVHTA